MLNKAQVMGFTGAAPDVRYKPDGSAVATINLATKEVWKDKQTGERKERTEWHRVVFFGNLAEVVAEYVKKGALIYVEGKIRTSEWTDNEGQKRYTTQIVADDMKMLPTGKKDSSNGADPQSSPSGIDGYTVDYHESLDDLPEYPGRG
ncbi:MAG: single-stranded DNA-binding protein [Methylococcales bacterium]|nr:single-stranded DNA-binding protein [Methylococcales bacterium]